MISVTHEGLSEMVGAHRETVTRTLGEFQQQALIELVRVKITVSDAARLNKLGLGEED